MKKIKQHLLSPDDLYALSFYSDRASDSGYFSIYETAENDLPKKSDGQYGDPSITCVTDNGLVDFEGEQTPYSRKKFVENPYYACIGCSYTVSKGLPVNYSWPSIVELFTGKTVNNYSELGAGYRKISSLTMDASARYGSPKHVLALMPDPYRIWFPYSWMQNVEIHSFSYKGNEQNNYNSSIVFGNAFWENEVHSYTHNHMASGHEPLRLVDHQGRKHIVSPELAAFTSMSSLSSLKKIFNSMSVPFDCMTWFHPDNPLSIDSHDVFNIKRKPQLRLETSTNHFQKFIDTEREIGGDGRWRRHGAPSRSGTCDHIPLTEHQKKFWYKSINSMHPGLHDQIHYAEQLLGTEIPCSILEEMP
jgi:hypothetical protein